MRNLFLKIALSVLLAFLPITAYSQTVEIKASQLVSRVELTFSPRSGSFVEGSTFDIPILVNTRGTSINGVEVRVTFDRAKLEIVKPSSGLSIIGVWVEPPGYDNTRGTASYVGVIPNGITTESGLIGTITFKAKSAGRAAVSFSTVSKVLLNDGQGTEAQLDLGRGDYNILLKAPEGVNIFSDTHPFSSEWYNNKNPIISWIKDEGVSGFSYVFDHVPQTVPENELNTTETSKAFEDLEDGLWYFHIKAYKNGVWGSPGHFLVRIDTAPPALFTPEVNYLLAALMASERAFISFFTTDNLSGISHYEVGIIDKEQPVTVSPVFVQSESPFQVPLTSDNLEVVVRAVDNAGNVRDVSIPVGPPSYLVKLLQDNLVYILLLIILVGILGMILHYLIGHHILRVFKKAALLVKQEEKANILETPAAPLPMLPPQTNEIIDNHPEG